MPALQERMKFSAITESPTIYIVFTTDDRVKET
jgi:hypothetical protein